LGLGAFGPPNMIGFSSLDNEFLSIFDNKIVL
jgi:hypothetical protein